MIDESRDQRLLRDAIALSRIALPSSSAYSVGAIIAAEDGVMIADGYSREFSNRGVMLVHGCSAPVVGRVSMDLTTIDLAQVPMAGVGDEVTILDDDPLSAASVYKLAKWANTIPYEIFCRIGSRIRRVAVDPADGRREMPAAADEESTE